MRNKNATSDLLHFQSKSMCILGLNPVVPPCRTRSRCSWSSNSLSQSGCSSIFCRPPLGWSPRRRRPRPPALPSRLSLCLPLSLPFFPTVMSHLHSPIASLRPRLDAPVAPHSAVQLPPQHRFTNLMTVVRGRSFAGKSALFIAAKCTCGSVEINSPFCLLFQFPMSIKETQQPIPTPDVSRIGCVVPVVPLLHMSPQLRCLASANCDRE